MKNQAVYPLSLTAAINGAPEERALYMESYHANVACKKAIEQAIAANFNGNTLSPNIAKSIIAEFGAERVNWVLSNTVQVLQDDRRFSHDTVKWAQNTDIPPDTMCNVNRRFDFAVNSHPAVLNGFIGQVRRELSAGLESKDQSAVPDRNGTHERTPSAETEDEWEP